MGKSRRILSTSSALAFSGIATLAVIATPLSPVSDRSVRLGPVAFGHRSGRLMRVRLHEAQRLANELLHMIAGRTLVHALDALLGEGHQQQLARLGFIQAART